MQIIQIGLRFSFNDGPRFFGIEEANHLISQGAVVLRLEPGGLLMQKTGEDQETVTTYISGFDAKVVLDDSRLISS
jgi:hypothetical protein